MPYVQKFALFLNDDIHISLKFSKNLNDDIHVINCKFF